MSGKRIYSIDKLPVGKTDWERVKKLSEDEIDAAAKGDPDAQLLSKEQLANFKRVHPPEEVDVKKIRQKLRMSQEIFAAFFGISKRTLQEWEQGRRRPEGPARTLLTVVFYEPEAVQRALTHEHAVSQKS